MRESTKKIGFNKIIMTVVVLIAGAGIGSSAYFYKQYQDLKNNPEQLQQKQKDRTKEIKAKVSKLISLPSDEQPVLMSVNDEEKLKNQPFFKDAQKGDQMLIFAQSKKAILYREKDNKLVNVGPIAITSDDAKSNAKDNKNR